jgi:type IV secretory pathway VirD2 relaxase
MAASSRSQNGGKGKSSPGGGDRTIDGGEKALAIRVSKGRAAKTGPAGRELVRQVKAAVHRAGGAGAGKTKGMRLVGRGAGVGGGASGRAQRVTVKARVVAVPKSGGKAAVMRYLGYIEREGGAKDGGVSERFGADGPVEEARLDAFADNCAEDRHSFRLIVSPEKGAAMDLEQHTRELMRQMERDLGTQLEWVAAVHHDTDNPHVHILIRGVDEKGKDLVMNKDYISHGIRARAGELATRELGYRTDLDVYQSLQKNLHKPQWTGLDNELLREQAASSTSRLEFARTPTSPFARLKREMKLERLGVLRDHGLAEQVAPGRWHIADHARETLQAMTTESARAGLLRPHVDAEQAKGYSLPDKETLKETPVRGLVLDRGLANTLTGTEYLVVGGFDGRVHYATVGHYAERHLSRPAKVGDTVTLSVAIPTAAGSADRNVMKRLVNGVYDPDEHLAEVQGRGVGAIREGITPESYIDAHVKRMESLATRGHVDALADGKFRVPADLLQRLDADPAMNRDRQAVVRVDVAARGSLAANARIVAQSFMDGELEGGTVGQLRARPALTRSQAAFLEALEARTDRLAELRLASRTGDGGVVLAPNFAAVLRERELADANTRLSSVYGQPVDLDAARRFQGTVAAIEQLPTGPHAVIVSDDTFALVPAKDGLERMTGRAVQVSLQRGVQIGQANFQQARLRFMAMETLTPTTDLGLGLDKR